MGVGPFGEDAAKIDWRSPATPYTGTLVTRSKGAEFW